VNGSVLPSQSLVKDIKALGFNEAIIHGDDLIAVRLNAEQLRYFNPVELLNYHFAKTERELVKINFPWDIFQKNGQALLDDFNLLTNHRKSAPVSKTNNILGKHNIFLEEGAKMEFATVNAEKGPVYIGKDAEIMEGSVIRGPLAMCEHSVLKLAAKIYGPTTLGPYCKVGGEVNNTVFIGYSNKAHDGFLGNSVIGEWCNLGADTNNSNLKNNYTEVKLWNYVEEKFVPTGLQFCGLIMGDHSKCGINTMFNTGTVIGINANIFGEGFPRNFIPSFSWGGVKGFKEYNREKAYEVAEKVMQRRNKVFDEVEKNILEEIYNRTQQYRNF
jgi:UDP-N-acetylglucosamine diphosphorylase/glucosamine-1-phosphate N-acetyltransferase